MPHWLLASRNETTQTNEKPMTSTDYTSIHNSVGQTRKVSLTFHSIHKLKFSLKKSLSQTATNSCSLCLSLLQQVCPWTTTWLCVSTAASLLIFSKPLPQNYFASWLHAKDPLLNLITTLTLLNHFKQQICTVFLRHCLRWRKGKPADTLTVYLRMEHRPCDLLGFVRTNKSDSLHFQKTKHQFHCRIAR